MALSMCNSQNTLHSNVFVLFSFFGFDGFIANKSKDSKAWQFLSCTCGQGYRGPPTQPFANMIRVGSPEKTLELFSAASLPIFTIHNLRRLILADLVVSMDTTTSGWEVFQLLLAVGGGGGCI